MALLFHYYIPQTNIIAQIRIHLFIIPDAHIVALIVYAIQRITNDHGEILSNR